MNTQVVRRFLCTNPSEILTLLQRKEAASPNVEQAVAEILRTVKQQGDSALFGYTKRFDGATVTELQVSEAEISHAVATVNPAFLTVMRQAHANIVAYHRKQLTTGYTMTNTPGVLLGRRVLPLDRVAIYVPGGTARYPSSVLMNAVPAVLAGVREIIMFTPPDASGKIPNEILAAASVAGVHTIYKVGGAQAIAAAAYGTQSIPKVDKIVGPGNIYVATAKKQIYGAVDIDMIAGPSEILIIADDSANPCFLAMDMLSQAEHDRYAASFLVTTSERIASETQEYLKKYLADLPKQEIAAHSLRYNGAIVVTDTLDTAVEISNQLAPEHLEIATDSPFSLLSQIRNAGSVFLGHYTPESLGDYFAGPNHILPTSGTARFSSGLSVDDFIKKSSFIYYDKQALEKVGEQVMLFARHEELEAHARAVAVRMENTNE